MAISSKFNSRPANSGWRWGPPGGPTAVGARRAPAVAVRQRPALPRRLYAELDIPEKAIGAYQKAVKVNPGDSLALSALGKLFDEKGENPEIALVFCKESVRLSPENPLFRERLARLYLKLNRLEEALKEFEQAGLLARTALKTSVGCVNGWRIRIDGWVWSMA